MRRNQEKIKKIRRNEYFCGAESKMRRNDGFWGPFGNPVKKKKMGGVLGAKFGPNLIDTVKKAEKVALSISFLIFCIGNTFRNKI